MDLENRVLRVQTRSLRVNPVLADGFVDYSQSRVAAQSSLVTDATQGHDCDLALGLIP